MTVLNWLFPAVCPACQIRIGSEELLCQECHSALTPLPENYCLRCGAPTLRPEPGCAQCLHAAYSADATFFAFEYEGVAARLILSVKFADHPEQSRVLGQLCWERLATALHWEAVDMVIPMPLHVWRLIGRRYNQAALLAGELAKRLERPLVTDILLRQKSTRPQTRLNARERHQNVRGAFHVHKAQLKGQTVLVVDDVMTTGATMRAAVMALKKAGAVRVVALCAARVRHEP
ncbi:MAG: ComF family protein [Magnetococcales bacterium]|nr:ComF family protein [Magnetococcales bacterium]NGZ04774.1 ComF family protein [Magnetococcales bacterium]